MSCRDRRGRAAARLAELETRTSDLPHAFPWPGLGERSQAVERARGLLEQASAEGPLLADLRAQVQLELRQRIGMCPSCQPQRGALPPTPCLLHCAISGQTFLLFAFVQAAQLFETTRDPDWDDSLCGRMEESVRVVLRDLTVSACTASRLLAFQGQMPQPDQEASLCAWHARLRSGGHDEAGARDGGGEASCAAAGTA